MATCAGPPAAPPPPTPPPAPSLAPGRPPGTSIYGREPPAETINAIIEAITHGEFQQHAFEGHGVPWGTARSWLKLGEASSKLHQEDGRPLTWQGALYEKVKRATALSISPVMVKLHGQAKEEGGELAIKFIKLRTGAGGGAAGGGAPAGRDYEEEQVASGRDAMTDEDVLELINASIRQARAAVEARA